MFDRAATLCARLVQGFPWTQRRCRWRRAAPAAALLVAVWAGSAPSAPAASCGPAPKITRLGAGVWLVPGVESVTGEPDAVNRGQVANLLAVADGDRLWLVGSGPSPAFGRRLACVLREQLGRDVTDAIAPWAHPELVLGQSGFDPKVRVHGHRAVAEAMRDRCAECVERLRATLGEAAADLGGGPVRLPDRIFDGDRGRLGPFEWRALSRGDAQVVTLWRVRGTPWRTAHGLLWGDGPPDGRGADLRRLAESTATAAAEADAAARWVPQQGPVLPGKAADAHRRYWQALLRGAEDGVARGAAGLPPPPVNDVAPAWSAHLRHGLNWQRAWRQAVDRAMDAAPKR